MQNSPPAPALQARKRPWLKAPFPYQSISPSNQKAQSCSPGNFFPSLELLSGFELDISPGSVARCHRSEPLNFI